MIVGRNWLGKAFGMDPDKTVKKRLANVEPHARLGNNCELYLLVVPPNITLLPLPSKCPELNPVENIW